MKSKLAAVKLKNLIQSVVSLVKYLVNFNAIKTRLLSINHLKERRSTFISTANVKRQRINTHHIIVFKFSAEMLEKHCIESMLAKSAAMFHYDVIDTRSTS